MTGDERREALCACGGAAAHRCTWPSEGYRSVPVEELGPGDTVLVRGRRIVVLQIETISAGGGWGRIAFGTAYDERGRRQPLGRGYGFLAGAFALALRPGPCGNAVCEAHVRELAESRRVCREHWNAWEEAV